MQGQLAQMMGAFCAAGRVAWIWLRGRAACWMDVLSGWRFGRGAGRRHGTSGQLRGLTLVQAEH